MQKIKVWRLSENEGRPISMDMEIADMHRFVSEAKRDGGFWTGEKKNEEFVPFHFIVLIERVSEETANAAETR